MTDDSEPTLTEVLAEMRGRFDTVDSACKAIDTRLASHSETLAWLKMNAGMVAQATAGIAAGVEQCNLQLVNKDQRLSRLESTIERLSEEVDLPKDPNS